MFTPLCRSHTQTRATGHTHERGDTPDSIVDRARDLLRRGESSRPADYDKFNWISDANGVLKSAHRQEINAQITELKCRTGAEMSVVILGDVEDTGYFRNRAKFTRSLFNHWGVGRRGINDGVVIVVFVDGRRVEIVTGRGITRSIPDSFLHDVNGRMIARFKHGRYGCGVEVGVSALTSRLAHHVGKDWVATVPSELPRHGAYSGGKGHRSWWSWFRGQDADDQVLSCGLALFLFFLWLCVLKNKWNERKRRQCTEPCCAGEASRKRVQMVSLNYADATTVDEIKFFKSRMTLCNTTEASLGTCGFERLTCPGCHCERLLRSERGCCGRNVAAHTCERCRCHTRQEESHTEVAATKNTEGVERHNSRCGHCDQCKTWTSVIGRLSLSDRLSDTSGSGGGGFSGGDCDDGGGAGGSW